MTEPNTPTVAAGWNPRWRRSGWQARPNQGLDQRRAGDPALIAEREHRRHHHAARMHRSLPEAIVELDAMRRGAAEERGIDQIGPPRAAGHRDAARRPHRRQHRLRAGRDLAARARDHDAHGIEQMAPRVVADLVGERGVAQFADEVDNGLGRADGGMKRLQGFSVGHAWLRMARGRNITPKASHHKPHIMSLATASTATTPSPAGRTIMGLISASATLASSASRDSATMAWARASRSPLDLPR
jgi:hypothetical protein